LIYTETILKGAYVITPERVEDERGAFARTFCRREFSERGLNPELAQCNISFNRARGTLRGMHFQVPPYAETKLVRCTRGAVYDLIIDLRPHSPTFRRWVGVTLDAGTFTMLYIPEGMAHGFLTLQDSTEVFYQMSEFYSAAHARGVRWDDPAFGIIWPEAPRIISQRDREYPDFNA
jgi:dTDP-4-dehydrorhamnose 3,5-epimerase